MFDGIDNIYFYAQMVGFCAMSISVLAWQLKNPRHVIFSYVPSCTLWAIQYVMLGAYIGALINICGAFKDGSLTFVKAKYVPYVIGTFLLTITGFGLHFMTSAIDLLPILAGFIVNISLLYRDNRSIVARGCLAGQMCWMSYNISVGAWMGFACAILVSASTLISMARYEGWEIGKCYKSFAPSIARALIAFQGPRTYP